MFENSEFQIDENSEEYKRLFPNGRKLDVKKDEDEELSGDVDSEGENGDALHAASFKKWESAA